MQRRLWCTAAMPLCLLAFVGCQTFAGQPRQPYENGRITAISDKLSKELDNGMETCSDVTCRNNTISIWIEAVDFYYHDLELRIGAASQGINITGDVGSVAASAAGTLVSGTHGKTVLAAIAAFFGGTKGALDKNLYAEQSSQVLTARMRSLRQAALVRITKGLHDPFSVYSLVDAKIDLNAYFEAGTLDAAISDIQNESSAQAKTAEMNVEGARTLTFQFDENSQVILNFWRPNAKENSEHAQALNDWIKANGIEDDLATIVNTSKYPDERKKIVGFISSYGPNEATKQLRALWKPNGKEDSAKKKVIEDYVSKNIKSKPDLATFLYSKDYTDQRNDAIKQPDLKP